MDIAIKILQFIASFSLLVIIHELGHFIFARMFGIRVEKFYLFFNPGFSLFKVKIGETEYGIGWIPFGGYVKIAGMIDESMDTEQMALPPQPDEFRSKPAWQRLLVMLGGIIMNVLLAVFIYIGMSWYYGDRYIANDDMVYGWAFNDLGHEMGFRNGDRILTVGGSKVEDAYSILPEMVINNVSETEVLRDGRKVTIPIEDNFIARLINDPEIMSPRIPFVAANVLESGGAANAGIEKGDSLIAINEVAMIYFDEYLEYIGNNAGKTIELTYARDKDGSTTEHTTSVVVSEAGKIGIQPYAINYYVPVQSKNYTFLESIPNGLKRTGTEISNYGKQLKLIFQPKTEAYKSLGGPIAIFQIFPDYWNWEVFWRLTAFLSLVLAVMNILPIPALDGGHVMFVLYEIITKRKPSEKFLEKAQMTGAFIILTLLILATTNDITRFFTK